MSTYLNPNAVKDYSITSVKLAAGVIPTDACIAAMGYTKNQGTITGITMNGTSKGTSGVVNLGTVITDVSNLATKSAAVGSLSLTLDSSDYKITLSGTKVDGTSFTVQNVIDLPLESVVVNGSYNSNTKKVVLTLQNGSTVEFSVADLVAGLQSEITSTNKLSADLIQDGTTNKTVTATEKSTWNGKQDVISDLATIRENASAGAAKVSNVQADWNASTGLAVILNKPTIPSAVDESTVSGWGFTKNEGTLTGVKFNNVDATISSGVASITATIPPEVTESTVSGWGFTKNAAPGTLNTDNSAAQTVNASEALSGTIQLHKVAKTGAYSDLIGAPAPGPIYYAPASAADLSFTKWNASVSGITSYYNGLTFLVVNESGATVEGSSTTFNVNGLGAKAIYRSYLEGSGPISQNLPANGAILLTYYNNVFYLQAMLYSLADFYSDSTHRLVSDASTAAWNGKQDVISDLATIRENASAGAAKVSNVQSDWNATSGLAVILNKPTIPAAPGALNTNNSTAQTVASSESLSGTVNLHKVAKTGTYSDLIGAPAEVTSSTVSGWGFTTNEGTITGISMNGSSKGTSGVVDLGTVITDVSNLATKSAAIGSLSLSLNSSDYKITLSGTKVDGTSFTVDSVIDLPLESVVVNGSYNNTTKKVVLTLQSGSTVEFSVADLVAGLQSEITSTNKLSADLIQDGTTNKTVTATEKSTWNGKQDAISDLATIRENASAGAAKVSNVQSDWNASTGLAVILNKPTIPAAPGTLNTNNATAQIASASEALSGTIKLHKIAKTGSYADSLDKPVIDTSSTTSLRASAETLDSTIYLHIISKTGSWNDLLDKPKIPDAPGTLDTTATTAQSTVNGEYLSGSVTLHKIAKTGTYGDLIGKPTIPTVNNATLTIQKNGTNVQTFTANASSNVTANITVNELPTVTSSDNGKVLMVVNGAWSTVTPVSIYSGSAAPNNSQGINGDIYLQV